MNKMRNRILIVIFPFLFISLFSCTQTNYVKIKMEIPKDPKIDLSPYKNILITKFLENEEIKDFDINKEISEYFSFELKKNLQKNIKKLDISVKKEEVFKDSGYWKKAISDEKESVLLTGSVKYNMETRKTIRKKEKRRFDDPFPEESRVESRNFFSLDLHLYLIDTQNGEIIYDRNFKENKSYQNPNQTADFAFFDLILDVRDKLLEDIQGYDRMKERYLLVK